MLSPVPDVITPPGLRVIIHVPDDGKSSSTTLPVDTLQLGAVIVPITGAEGVGGCELIVTSEEETEVHPPAFVTVKE